MAGFDPESLFTALRTKFSADGSLSAAVTGFGPEELLTTTALPYIVYKYVGGRPDYEFGGENEKCIIQFEIWSNSATTTEIHNIFDLLTKCFDLCSLTFSGGDYRSIYMVRQESHFERVEQTWLYVVDYEVYLEKV